jgi:hypothetical protein
MEGEEEAGRLLFQLAIRRPMHSLAVAVGLELCSTSRLKAGPSEGSVMSRSPSSGAVADRGLAREPLSSMAAGRGVGRPPRERHRARVANETAGRGQVQRSAPRCSRPRVSS